MQYQVIIYGIEGDIISSQHFDNELTEVEVIDIIEEDDGVKAEVYLVDGDEYSKHLDTFELIF